MAIATVFESIEAFYEADSHRRRSGESDFGVWWRDGTANVPYRISAVKDTGEIYALALRSGPGVPAGQVELLARGLPVGSYDESERLLDGWAEICGEQDSLAWARQRLRQVAP